MYLHSFLLNFYSTTQLWDHNRNLHKISLLPIYGLPGLSLILIVLHTIVLIKPDVVSCVCTTKNTTEKSTMAVNYLYSIPSRENTFLLGIATNECSCEHTLTTQVIAVMPSRSETLSTLILQRLASEKKMVNLSSRIATFLKARKCAKLASLGSISWRGINNSICAMPGWQRFTPRSWCQHRKGGCSTRIKVVWFLKCFPWSTHKSTKRRMRGLTCIL